MSHAATTWQSSDARKDCVLPGPCQPMPITPRLIVLLAEAPELCLAKAGRTAGRIAADPAAFRKLRRLKERSWRDSSERERWDILNLNITFRSGVANAHVECAPSFVPVPLRKAGMEGALSVTWGKEARLIDRGC